MNIHDKTRLERLLTAMEAIKAGPRDKDLETAPTLDFWSAVIVCDVPRLIGFVTGHPNLPNTEVCTSMLLFVSKDASHARTLSSWYRLGIRDDKNRARLDWMYQTRLNLKSLAGHRQKLREENREASIRAGDDGLIERAQALGTVVSHYRR